MGELVAFLLYRSGQSTKRNGQLLSFGAASAEQDSDILGFADWPKRRSAKAPLQLKEI